jgi:hypothetical protein
LAASLAHELSQPIAGAITNTNVCLRKLGHDKPDLDEVRAAVTRIGRDAQPAAETIGRIRSQFEKGASNRVNLDMNEIIPETLALLRDQAMRYDISVRSGLAADLPQIVGDRLQLQQVAMNLIVNSIEAMKDVDGVREMVVQSQRTENGQILVSSVIPAQGSRRNLPNRYSIRSLQRNLTAPAWGFASAGRSLSLTVDVFGRSVLLEPARLSTHPACLRREPKTSPADVVESSWSPTHSSTRSNKLLGHCSAICRWFHASTIDFMPKHALSDSAILHVRKCGIFVSPAPKC